MNQNNLNKITNEDEIKILQKLSSIEYEDRKKFNLNRQTLQLLLKLYENGDLSELCPQLIDSQSNKIDISNFKIKDQDLSGFDFSNFLLKFCNFTRSKFNEDSAQTIIYRAKDENICLVESDFSNANYALRKVNNSALGMEIKLPYNFSQLNLSKTNFARADLTGANFKEAILVGVNFSFAILNQASFNNSDIAQANFENAIFYPEQFVEVENFEKAHFDDEQVIEIIKSLKNKSVKKDLKISNLLFAINQKIKNIFKSSILFTLVNNSKSKDSKLNKTPPSTSPTPTISSVDISTNNHIQDKRSYVAKISEHDKVKTSEINK